MRANMRPALPWEGGGGLRGAVRRLGWRWLGGSAAAGFIVGMFMEGPGLGIAFAVIFPLLILLQELLWGGQNERVDQARADIEDGEVDDAPIGLLPVENKRGLGNFMWRHRVTSLTI